jgi:hypothetical protein
MIQLEENEIGILVADQFLKEKSSTIEALKALGAVDVILDCSEHTVSVKSLVIANSRCFVMVIPTDRMQDFPEELNVVPTRKEAEDFISFERMQRDLGIEL